MPTPSSCSMADASPRRVGTRICSRRASCTDACARGFPWASRSTSPKRSTSSSRRRSDRPREAAVKILFAGIIARYPFGGVTWCSLMYLLGLRALGHEVFYIEDTGECVYDPVLNTRATDPSYGTTYIHSALEAFGLGDRWSFVNYDGSYHGRSAEDVQRFCAGAELFINLSGGSWFWRDEYARI